MTATFEDLPVNILMILDGWGISDCREGNAFALADTPVLDKLLETYPNCRLKCCGEAVGLPEGTMGNSEVGHMNIGAGRTVFQDFARIKRAIRDRSFFSNRVLLNSMERSQEAGKTLHLMGLVSDGGVHSHLSHLFALIDMAEDNGIENLYIHAILDGRDTSPTSGIGYIRELQEYLGKKRCGKIADIVGRYWAMDRDKRWDRIEKAYRLLTQAEGAGAEDPVKAVEKSYAAGLTDEFFEPVVIDKEGSVRNDSEIIFFNFRADRAKEMTRALIEPGFGKFKRDTVLNPESFVCMTRYDESFDLPLVLPTEHLSDVFGKILSENDIPQLRIAETEKYAHVTYFFDGGELRCFKKDERIIIPSPRDVSTYDQKPEMSAYEITDTVCEKIQSGEFRFIILNFANMDMVGHTGILEAAVKGCETVDRCVERILGHIFRTGGIAFITSDHGNSEQMIQCEGSPHTAHTLNSVRFIIAGEQYKNIKLRDGILADIAPTILKVLNIEKPSRMSGKSLI